MVECAASAFVILKSAGYIAWDPQLGRIVTEADLNDMVAQYRRMDNALPGILADLDRRPAGAKKPWWKVW